MRPNLLGQGPLEPLRANALRRWLGALCAPDSSNQLSPLVETELRAKPFLPLPRLPACVPLEPLFQERLRRIGVGFDEVFAHDPGLPPLPAIAQLAAADLQRVRLLEQLIDALADAAVGRIVLIKGAAVARKMPAPALRLMCDVDLLIGEDKPGSAAAVLSGLGCQSAGRGAYRHPSGMMIDVKLETNPLRSRLIARATPLLRWRGKTAPNIPVDADHLLLLALHSLDGIRIWRDVADAHVLLGEEPANTASEAMQGAVELGLTVPLCAIFRFMNEWSPAALRLPPVPPGGFMEDEETQCRHIGRLYRELSADTIPPAAFGLVRSVLKPLMGLRGGPVESQGAEQELHDLTSREVDPRLGELPAPGTLARAALKLRLALQFLRSPQRRRWATIMRLHQVTRVTRWKL